MIGAMRSATSTLYSYIAEHPKVTPVDGKEIHFFSDEKLYAQGLDWYFSKFFDLPNGEITGEASPSYFAATLVPRRIKNLLPDVKIIMCIRNPGERSISHFYWNKFINLENNSFESIFRDDNISEVNHYIGNSMYAKNFYWWLNYFDPSQIAVVFFDDIINSPQKVMDELFNFLNLHPINLSNTIHHHPTSWQSNIGRHKEVVLKINQYLYDDTLTFLHILHNYATMKVIGKTQSINYVQDN